MGVDCLSNVWKLPTSIPREGIPRISLFISSFLKFILLIRTRNRPLTLLKFSGTSNALLYVMEKNRVKSNAMMTIKILSKNESPVISWMAKNEPEMTKLMHKSLLMKMRLEKHRLNKCTETKRWRTLNRTRWMTRTEINPQDEFPKLLRNRKKKDG